MHPIEYIYESGCIERFVRCNRGMDGCIQLIKEILKHEHYKAKKSPFVNQTALNLDVYEQQRSAGNTQCTVDFVVGLKGDWLMPVEAKLDVKNVENIIKDINTKRAHSLDLLRSANNYIHNTPFVVILLENPQKVNRLKRLMGYSPSYELHTVDSFHQSYFAAPLIK